MKMGESGCMEQWWGMDLMIIMGEVTEQEYQRWAKSSPGPADTSNYPNYSGRIPKE